MKNTFSYTDETIDSRDIDNRIDELISLRDDFYSENNLNNYVEEERGNEQEKWSEWDDSSDGKELKILQAVKNDCDGYVYDWKYGVQLIRDDYFTEYCKELVDEIGDLPNKLPSYIKNNIDWEGVADDLKVDYTETSIDNVVYYVR